MVWSQGSCFSGVCLAGWCCGPRRGHPPQSCFLCLAVSRETSKPWPKTWSCVLLAHLPTQPALPAFGSTERGCTSQQGHLEEVCAGGGLYLGSVAWVTAGRRPGHGPGVFGREHVLLPAWDRGRSAQSTGRGPGGDDQRGWSEPHQSAGRKCV